MSKAAFTTIKTLVESGAIRQATSTHQYVWKDFVTMVNEGAAGLLPDPLTPAQEHADEMVEALRYVASGNPGSAGVVRAVLDKIDPPKPVTLEEAINAVRKLMGMEPNPPGFAEALLRRFDTANKGVEYKVFATARGETPVKPLPIPEAGDYGPGCVNHLSVQRYKALISVGWTDALLIQHGLMK